MTARRWLRDLDVLMLDGRAPAATSTRLVALAVRAVLGAVVGAVLGLVAVYPLVLLFGWLAEADHSLTLLFVMPPAGALLGALINVLRYRQRYLR